MKKVLLIIGLTAIVAGFFWFYLSASQDANLSRQQITRLQQMGDECTGISEKAVIGLTSIVEFQKLEILSRKANVMKKCMADRGFQESPVWRKYTEPLARITASRQNISFAEAIENIRKVDMWILKNQDQRPMYWTSTKN